MKLIAGADSNSLPEVSPLFSLCSIYVVKCLLLLCGSSLVEQLYFFRNYIERVVRHTYQVVYRSFK